MNDNSGACRYGKDRPGKVFRRRKTRQIEIGGVAVGGDAPIIVQSMTKTDTRDRISTIAQIEQMVGVGCEIVRVAVPDTEAAGALKDIKKHIAVPLIADIHFDFKLALAALEQGVDGLRINPGNIGSKRKIQQVVAAAKERSVPIRIGVNAGSLEKDLLRKFGAASPEAMVASAVRHVRILEDLNFNLIKLSLKASDVQRTLRAYRLMAEKVDYPFHAGITEAGSLLSGSIKSAAGIALLLHYGLVDTLRVSLTAPPEEEIRVAYRILSSFGVRSRGLNIVSCPTCGRCEVDLMAIAAAIENRLSSIDENITVAVMGCMVNGPGEAKEADIGIACGRGAGVVFKKGVLLRRLEEHEIVPEFVAEVHDYLNKRR
ncbi:MAG: flavodoxin-dependent (E)-4-hydroxy-3-methylbut-2-enyl-diphosphate synthase [Candidatus Aminicenantes bacterium]|nr:flavodoxin-dependent (E)-4-hydroxy-3-methylbut-2-enyl-diphosphate synthase [Candidatus Aminicenantes bacterium]